MIKRKKRAISLGLAVSYAKRQHSTKILLYYGMVICIVAILVLLIRHGIRNETQYLYEPIVAFISCVFLVTILVIVAIKQDASLIKSLDAKVITESDKPELFEAIRFISEKAKISIPTVYLTEKNCVTTLSSGWSPQKGIIVLSSKAIKILEKEELDSIIAHEISHIKQRDYLGRAVVFFSAGIIFAITYGFAWLPVDTFWEIVANRSSRSCKSPIVHFKQIVCLPGIFLTPFAIICAWCIGIPIRSLFIEQEYRADIGSIQITGNSSALARAIAKLALAWQTPIGDSAGFFMLFDMVKPSYRNKMQRRLFEFFQGSVTGQAVKRANRLESLKI